MKKILLSLLICGSLGLTACENDGLTINVGEQQIEGKIAKYFPVHKEALLGKLQLDLKQPDLILKSGSDRAELLLQSQISMGPAKWPGQFLLSFG